MEVRRNEILDELLKDELMSETEFDGFIAQYGSKKAQKE
jgi:hypothetical protein